MFKAIAPNWHPLLVHFPLALLIVGVGIELLAFMWRRSAARTAARWMILLGALAAVPTVTTGIYAFANAASGSASPGAEGTGEWSEIVAKSQWGPEQWWYMRWHIILMVAGTGAVLVAAIAYLGSSEERRRGLYLPALGLLAVGVGLMMVGGWFSGEAVYRHDVAVVPPAGMSVPAGSQLWAEDEQGGALWGPNAQRFIPPLQLHTLFAGLTVAVACVGLGTMLRNWSMGGRAAGPVTPAGPRPTPVAPGGEVRGPVAPATVAMPGGNRPDAVRPEPAKPPVVQPPAAVAAGAWVPSGRFWAIACVLGAITGLAGLWFTEQGNWRFPEMGTVYGRWFSDAKISAGDRRLAVHGVLAAGIVLLTLLLGFFARFGRRRRVVPVILLLLLAAAVGLQIWVGVLLMYNMRPTLL